MMMNRAVTSLAARRLLERLGQDSRGATAIEYGLILGLMTIAMLVTFTSVANSTTAMWRNVSTKVEQAR